MSDLRRIILVKKSTNKQDTGSGSMQQGPSRRKMWQEVAQTKKSRAMVAKMRKDSRGSRTLQKSESWDGFWVLVLTPAAPIPLLSHRATVLWCRWGVGPLHFIEIHPCLWCRWGVRPLHFIETHLASKGPVVARCGRRLPKPRSQEGWWQRCERIVEEVELCRKVRAEMASEYWFWPLLLQFLCSHTEQQCYGAGGGLDPSIL